MSIYNYALAFELNAFKSQSEMEGFRPSISLHCGEAGFVHTLYLANGKVVETLVAATVAPNMYKVLDTEYTKDIVSFAKFTFEVTVEGTVYVGHKAPRALMSLWKELATIHGGRKLMSLVGQLIVTKTKQAAQSLWSFLTNLPTELKALWQRIVEVLKGMEKEDWIELLLTIALAAAGLLLINFTPMGVLGCLAGWLVVKTIEDSKIIFNRI